MIKIKQCVKIDESLLGSFAQEELQNTKQYAHLVLTHSDIAIEVYKDSRLLFIFGVLPRTFLGPKNEVWVLAGKNLRPKDIKPMVPYFNVLRQMFGGLRANILKTNKQAARFAQFFGLHPVGIMGDYVRYEG